MKLALIFILVLAVLLTGMPIFAGLGLTSIGLTWAEGGDIIGESLFVKLSNELLLAIPLFALMAHILVRAKVVEDLYAFAHVLVRHWPGGLGVATILACTLFAAISGSSAATALTIGSAALPQMARYGYNGPAAYGTVAAGGTLGILIPPSGPAILYSFASDASIGALFLAGVIPGLLLAIGFAVYHMIIMRRSTVERPPRASRAEILQATRRALPALILPPIVLGGIYTGWFTATEAAGVGSLLALIIAVVFYRYRSIGGLIGAARDALRLSAMVFMIIIGAHLFGHVLTLMRIPDSLVAGVSDLGLGPDGFILLMMLVILVLGMFLETVAIILITTPIILPVMLALEIDPVWYGILLMINLEMALITPPVGMNLFVIKGITKAPMRQVVGGTLPYVLLMAIGLAAVFFLPGLALWLPTLMGYGL